MLSKTQLLTLFKKRFFSINSHNQQTIFDYLFTISKPFQVVSEPPAIFVPLRGQNALKIEPHISL